MSQPTQMASDHDIMITHTRMHTLAKKQTNTRTHTHTDTHCDVFLSKGKDNMSRVSDRQSRDRREIGNGRTIELPKSVSGDVMCTPRGRAAKKTSLLNTQINSSKRNPCVLNKVWSRYSTVAYRKIRAGPRGLLAVLRCQNLSQVPQVQGGLIKTTRLKKISAT